MQRKPAPNSASPANIQNVVAQNSSLMANALKISVDSDSTKPAHSISAASCQRKRPRFAPDADRNRQHADDDQRAAEQAACGDSVSPSTR